MSEQPIGSVFPPRDAFEALSYPSDDTLAGYMDHTPGDDPPGPNHAPGYRWGWHNRRYDSTLMPDAYADIRAEAARLWVKRQ